MSQALSGTLKKTPLNARHRSLGARMVEYGGWDMPVEDSGIVDEHQAVRARAGLFDVSHMGEIEIAGRDALQAVQHITSNDASRLAIGQAHYSALPTPQGTFVDDVLTYKLTDEHFMLVVNASNIMKDFNWITTQIAGIGDAVAVNTSSRYALMALQGPAARRRAADADRGQPGRHQGPLVHDRRDCRCPRDRLAHRYTGEDGFEVFVPPASAERVWDAIFWRGRALALSAGRAHARTLLDLEAGDARYGNDIDDDDDRAEGRISGWTIGWKKDEFMGHEALRDEKQGRCGAELSVPGPRRAHRPTRLRRLRRQPEGWCRDDGTQSTPYLQKRRHGRLRAKRLDGHGTPFEIDVRGRRVREGRTAAVRQASGTLTQRRQKRRSAELRV